MKKILIQIDEELTKQAVRDYEHHLDSILKEVGKDFKAKFPDSQKFHEFITADLLGSMGIKKGDDFDLDKFEISMDNNEIDVEIEDGTIEIIDGPASPGIEYNLIHLGK